MSSEISFVKNYLAVGFWDIYRDGPKVSHVSRIHIERAGRRIHCSQYLGVDNFL